MMWRWEYGGQLGRSDLSAAGDVTGGREVVGGFVRRHEAAGAGDVVGVRSALCADPNIMHMNRTAIDVLSDFADLTHEGFVHLRRAGGVSAAQLNAILVAQRGHFAQAQAALEAQRRREDPDADDADATGSAEPGPEP